MVKSTSAVICMLFLMGLGGIHAILFTGKGMAATDSHIAGESVTGGLSEILELDDMESWRFLSKLTESEQDQLARRVAYLLEEEGGIVVSLMVAGIKILPNFIVVTIAHRLEPETVAKLSGKLPAKTAVRVAKGLKRDYLVEVTKHLKPDSASDMIEACPMELVTDVAKRLLDQNGEKVLAGLSDRLSAEKLKELSLNLSPGENVRIANHMKNRAMISRILITFPDDYLVILMKESYRFAYFSLVADVTSEMDTARIHRLLEAMAQEDIPKSLFMADVAVYMSPLKTVSIMNPLSDQLLIDVTHQLIVKDAYSAMGGIADHVTPDRLFVLSESLTPGQNVKTAYYMKNQRVIAKVLSAYSDDYVIDMMKESSKMGYHELILDIMAEMEAARVKKLTLRAEQEKLVSDELLMLIK